MLRSLWRFGGWRGNLMAVALLGPLVTLLYVPVALAFPHQARFGSTMVYADRPIGPAMPHVLARADALLAASPLDQPGLARTVVLTDGGWRWRVMALDLAGAIGLRRPFSSVLVFNRSDVARDRVTNGANVRTLSGAIAHEMTQLLTARRYGEWRVATMPAWKREGYAEVVAGETSIRSAAHAAAIRARDPQARVLTYYEGRRRVAAELARNGGSVDALFK